MRILLVTGSYPPMPCGVGSYTAALAAALVRTNSLEVGVLTGEGAINSNSGSGLEVVTLPCRWGWGDLGRLTRTIRKWKPDIVHVQYPTQAYGDRSAPWLIPAMLRMAGIPVVQTWHEFMPRAHWLRVAIAAMATRVIVVRPNYEASLARWFKKLLGQARPQYIPNAPVMEPCELTDIERQRIRERYAPAGRNLVVYFGFMYPHKGVEQMFEIADPERDQLVIAGHMDPAGSSYHRALADLAAAPKWRRATTFTGYLTEKNASDLAASADAVIFPFRDGVGSWNTSVAGVRTLGVFVIATARERQGYDAETNTFFCAPDDIPAMRAALRQHAGHRIPPSSGAITEAWERIAREHIILYRESLGSRSAR